ncbi:hypothetical protein A1O7_00988 [Cladophialophora yegresii CBS 114405]|uniref:CmcJ-like methyltransferase n=1 Tax=Cladophialophora yegresii CBS 114405 TaxID=1182544 RepID=W9WI38_9EURO|nr:uncharacterized protein A1O7_00988 [Cladophialophora yegresii CBS 114405]EXJ64650.1 hypothetical protein A1O7_00988 [Cladophialophora yegresii CBS 114405]
MKAPKYAEINGGDVTTTVQYLQPGSKNIRYFGKGKEVNIGKYDDVSVVIHDARPNKDEYTLENGGFALVQHDSKVTEWNSREQLDTIYPDEMAALVKSMTGADDVVVVSPPVLRKTLAEVGLGHQPRAADVHTDWSPANAEETAVRHADKDGITYSRCIFVNVWRALSPPPQDWPLAVIDARTVGADEGVGYPMIIVDKIPETLPMVPQPSYFIEGANFNYNPEHQWCYFRDMKIDEVLAFKLYDSDRHRGSQSWRCPHTAFLNPVEGSSPRESVEVRTICYFR